MQLSTAFLGAIVGLVTLGHLTLASPILCRQCFDKTYAELEEQYCKDDGFHCIYVNDNFKTDAFATASVGLRAHHESDPITLYVLKDGVSSTYKGTCSNGETVDGYFHMENARGSFINLYSGPLNGYWKSNLKEKLQAGKIETIVAGDDAVIYCPA